MKKRHLYWNRNARSFLLCVVLTCSPKLGIFLGGGSRNEGVFEEVVPPWLLAPDTAKSSIDDISSWNWDWKPKRSSKRDDRDAAGAGEGLLLGVTEGTPSIPLPLLPPVELIPEEELSPGTPVTLAASWLSANWRLRSIWRRSRDCPQVCKSSSTFVQSDDSTSELTGRPPCACDCVCGWWV